MGLPYSPAREEIVPSPERKEMKITDADRAYWAYRPLSRPDLPKVRNTTWLKNPIDAFILAKLEEKGLAPAPSADRITLIRRVSYDLTGLPPTPEEIDLFVNDRSPDAYEKLVDRLLASPGYGEKWGRHWLDLVRFADTHGYERDSVKPFAWRYRDYVINAFNSDKPYDRFLQEQLAGDELDDPTSETLIATGYYRLGIWDDEPADRLQLKYEVLDGIVTTTSQVALGMTVGCARCHDHKKDPIPQKDYYRLLAFFSDVADMNGKNLRRVATAADRRAHQQEIQGKQEREGKLYQEQYRLEQKFLSALASKKGHRCRPADRLGHGGSRLSLLPRHLGQTARFRLSQGGRHRQGGQRLLQPGTGFAARIHRTRLRGQAQGAGERGVYFLPRIDRRRSVDRQRQAGDRPARQRRPKSRGRHRPPRWSGEHPAGVFQHDQ